MQYISRNYIPGDGEVTWWLRVLTSLLEGLCSVPSTHVRFLRAAYNSTWGIRCPCSGLRKHYINMLIQTHLNTHRIMVQDVDKVKAELFTFTG